jgi:hypothetical protein
MEVCFSGPRHSPPAPQQPEQLDGWQGGAAEGPHALRTRDASATAKTERIMDAMLRGALSSAHHDFR